MDRLLPRITGAPPLGELTGGEVFFAVGRRHPSGHFDRSGAFGAYLNSVPAFVLKKFIMPGIGERPPEDPVPGQLFWSKEDGQLYVWNGEAWVAASCCTSAAMLGLRPPADPSRGMLWWDRRDGQLYVYTGRQWVAASCCTLPVMPPGTVLGNAGPGPAEAHVLNREELTSLINLFTKTLPGLVPPPGDVPDDWTLAADGSWKEPASGTAVGPQPPSDPTPGQLWWDQSVSPGVMKIWDGTAWVNIPGYLPLAGGTLTGGLYVDQLYPVTGGGLKISPPRISPPWGNYTLTVENPGGAGAALFTNLVTVQGGNLRVQSAGTGQILFEARTDAQVYLRDLPNAPNSAANKQYVDANSAANKQYVDDNFLPLAGGEMVHVGDEEGDGSGINMSIKAYGDKAAVNVDVEEGTDWAAAFRANLEGGFGMRVPMWAGTAIWIQKWEDGSGDTIGINIENETGKGITITNKSTPSWASALEIIQYSESPAIRLVSDSGTGDLINANGGQFRILNDASCILKHDPIQPLEAATKQYVDNGLAGIVVPPPLIESNTQPPLTRFGDLWTDEPRGLLFYSVEPYWRQINSLTETGATLPAGGDPYPLFYGRTFMRTSDNSFHVFDGVGWIRIGPYDRMGVTNGQPAAAGEIGEVISVSFNGTVNRQATVNMYTLPLTAGDWEIRGSIDVFPDSSGTDLVQVLVQTTAGSPIYRTLVNLRMQAGNFMNFTQAFVPLRWLSNSSGSFTVQVYVNTTTTPTATVVSEFYARRAR